MSEYLPPPPAANQPWAHGGPHEYPAAPMPPMRSLKGLALAASILLAIAAVVDVANVVARMNRASLLGDVREGSLSVDFQDLIDADDAVAATAGLHLFVFVAISVVFIIWQWRHAKNAQSLGVRGGLGPGWAIGGWFVPLANFVLPGMQLFQSSKGSDVDARRAGRSPKGAGVIIPWAIAFALGAIVLAGSGALVSSDEEGNVIIESDQDIEDAEASDQSAAFGFVLLVLAALLGIAVVRTLTARQAAAYSQLAATAPPHTLGAPPPPPPGAPPPGPPPGAPPPSPPPGPSPSAPPPPPGPEGFAAPE